MRAYADELLQTMLAELGSPAANAGPPAGAATMLLRTPMGSTRTATPPHLPGSDRDCTEARRPAEAASAAQAAEGPRPGSRAGLGSGQEADARLRMEVDALLGDVCLAGMAGRGGASAAAEAADALLDTLEAATAVAGGPPTVAPANGPKSALDMLEAATAVAGGPQALAPAKGGDSAGAGPGRCGGQGDAAAVPDAAGVAAGVAATFGLAGVVGVAAGVLDTGEAAAGDLSMSAGVSSVLGSPEQRPVVAGQRQASDTQPSPEEGSGFAAGKQVADGSKLAPAEPSEPSGNSEAQQHEHGGLAYSESFRGSDALSGVGLGARPAPDSHLVEPSPTDSASAAGVDEALTLSLSSDRDDAFGNDENEAPAGAHHGGHPAAGLEGRSPGGYPLTPPSAASPALALSGRGSPAAQPPTPKSAEQAADPGQGSSPNPVASPTRARAARRVPLAAMDLELAPGSPIVVPSPLSDPVGSPLRRSSRFLAEATGSGSGSGLGSPHALRGSALQGLERAASQGAPGLVRSPDAQPPAEPLPSGAAGTDGASAAAATPQAATAPASAGKQSLYSLHFIQSGKPVSSWKSYIQADQACTHRSDCFIQQLHSARSRHACQPWERRGREPLCRAARGSALRQARRRACTRT